MPTALEIFTAQKFFVDVDPSWQTTIMNVFTEILNTTAGGRLYDDFIAHVPIKITTDSTKNSTEIPFLADGEIVSYELNFNLSLLGVQPMHGASGPFATDVYEMITHEFTHMSGLTDNVREDHMTNPDLLTKIRTALGTPPTDSSSPNVDFSNLIKNQMRTINSSVSPNRTHYDVLLPIPMGSIMPGLSSGTSHVNHLVEYSYGADTTITNASDDDEFLDVEIYGYSGAIYLDTLNNSVTIESPDGENSLTLAFGAWSNVAVDGSGNTVISLSDSHGNDVGKLTYIPDGTSFVQLANGLTIDVSSLPSDAVLTNTSTLTAEDALLDYLDQLGVSMTTGDLEDANEDYFTETPSANILYYALDQIDPWHANAVFTSQQNGDIVVGTSTVTIEDPNNSGNYIQIAPTYNIFQASGDITQDDISGIQIFRLSDVVTMTADQFSSFAFIENGFGSLTLQIIGGDTVSLQDSNVDTNLHVATLEAVGWEGTTLVGNDDTITLKASLFGEDTLVAGDGSGSHLIAGLGVDTLLGGSGGGNWFTAEYGLAIGSDIEGQGIGNILSAAGDITGAAISGIQTFEVLGNTTMTGDQLNGFDEIIQADVGAITVIDDGIYDLNGKIADSNVIVVAGSNAGTTLSGDNTFRSTLVTSEYGDDTLISGAVGDYLDASYSYGNVTLLATNDATLDASGSSGNNTLSVTGDYNTLDASYSDGNNLLEVDGTNNVLDVSYSIGDNELTAVDGATMKADYSVGNNTLVTGDALSFLSADYSYGNNTLTAGSAFGSIISVISSAGDNTLTMGGGIGITLNASGATGNNTFIADGNGSSTIYGGNGDDIITLTTGSGSTEIYTADGSDSITINAGSTSNGIHIGSGVKTITLGSGTAEVLYADSGLTAGTTITSNTSNSFLYAEGNISGATITGIDIFGSTTGATITSSQLAGFSLLQPDTILNTAAGGTYNIGGGRGNTGNVVHATTNDGTTLIAGNADGLTFYASASGTDTLTMGNGAGDTAYAGAGVNTITMGTGANDLVVAAYGLASGSSVTMHTSTSTLRAEGDISSATLSGVHTLGSTTGVTLTSAQLAGVSLLEANTILYAATSGTYSMGGGRGTTGDKIYATSNGGTTLIAGNAAQNELHASASGNDTLTAGNGNGDVLDASNSSGNITMTAGNGTGDVMKSGTGNDTMTSGNGTTSYVFGNSFGQDTISNTGTSGTTAHGKIDFGGSIDYDSLWFEQVGNNLQIDLLGTSDHVTVNNWFGANAAAQVTSINTSDDMHLDSQVAQLVQAMATYVTNNSSFDPTSATAMPTDTTLQTALTSSWHS